jgi:hypothetical protein
VLVLGPRPHVAHELGHRRLQPCGGAAGGGRAQRRPRPSAIAIAQRPPPARPARPPAHRGRCRPRTSRRPGPGGRGRAAVSAVTCSAHSARLATRSYRAKAGGGGRGRGERRVTAGVGGEKSGGGGGGRRASSQPSSPGLAVRPSGCTGTHSPVYVCAAHPAAPPPRLGSGSQPAPARCARGGPGRHDAPAP